MDTTVRARMKKEQHDKWLEFKRVVAKLTRGLEELGELRRKYGDSRDFDLTERHQQGMITKAEDELEAYETEMTAAYGPKSVA